MEFKKYRRTNIAEMRPVTSAELVNDRRGNNIPEISISHVDIDKGSPKIGDIIARNPQNHKDQWLVSEEYFKDNFEEVK